MGDITVTFTALEARMLGLGADAGTTDDDIHNLGWKPLEKAAFRRAERKLWQALNGATPSAPPEKPSQRS